MWLKMSSQYMVKGSLFVIAAMVLVSIVSGLPVHNPDTGTEYATIHDAIDDAATLDGHTILVDSGLYLENVNVTKSLTIRGNDTGAGLPQVRYEAGNYRVLNVSADGVTIEDLRLQGLSGWMTGVRLSSSNGSTIRNVTFDTCYYGVDLDRSDNTLIAGNTFENCSQGLYLYRSKNATVSENILTENRGIGMRLQGSSGSTVKDNILNGTGASTGIFNDDSNAVYTGNVVSNFSRGIDIYGSMINPATVYNNYFDNTYNARADGLSAWNVTPAPGTNVIGGPYIGGNYWSDYFGSDVDGNGLGDNNLPHRSSNIAAGGDRAPLTVPETVPDRVHNLNTGRHYRAIQHAIDDPAILAGHTLAVDSGTYKELVNVTKALTIAGQDTGGGLPVIIPGPVNAVTLFAGKSTIERLRVESLERGSGSGFLLVSSDNTLTGCAVKECGIGIWLVKANNNTVSACEVTGVDFAGVYLQRSSNNTFTKNNVSYNSPSPGYVLQYGFSLDEQSRNNTLIENTVNHNVFGVYIKGSSDNTTLLRNTVTNNNVGIVLESSDGHTVEDNVAMENSDTDISLFASGDNRIENNTLGSSGAGGSGIKGSGIDNLIANNTIHSARVPGSPAHTFGIDVQGSGYSIFKNSVRGYYAGVRLTGSNQSVVENEITDNEESGLAMTADTGILYPSPPHVWKFSDFNTITENTVARNGEGISLSVSSHNVIRNNTVSENHGAGITITEIEHYFFDGPYPDEWGDIAWYYWDGSVPCTNNTVTGNTIADNGKVGINLTTSSGHVIHNNRFANTLNAWSTGTNTWNVTRTPGENIIGGSYLGGNSWDDYTGADLDGDTIGDTLLPYNASGMIISGGDLLPLTTRAGEEPVAGFAADPTSGTAPLTVQFNDTSTGSPAAWNWTFGDGAWFNTTDPLARNATHAYTSAGAYTVSLTVSGPGGSDTATETDYITVTPGSSAGPVHNLDTGIDYATIGDAITDAATLDRHTILIDSGTYVESVNVTKSLTTRGLDTGGGMPVLDGRNLNTVIQIPADNVAIEELNIVNATSGILITGDRAALTNLTIRDCRWGVRLESTHGAAIRNATLHDNSYGIYNLGGRDTEISDCSIMDNVYNGVRSTARTSGEIPENTTIVRCFIHNNGYGYLSDPGVEAAGVYIGGGSRETKILDCTLSRNLPLGVFLINTTGSLVYGNVLRDHNRTALADFYEDYLSLSRSNETTIIANTFEGNNAAIHFVGHRNAITQNRIVKNREGIRLTGHDNIVYDNIIDNACNAVSLSSSNSWNVTKRPGPNIIGGPFIGGNAWGGYTGQDVDGDGLGDTAIPWKGGNASTVYFGYLIEYGGDMHPLTVPDSSLPARVENERTGTRYQTIQRGIDDPATLAGDTILVESGRFFENVNVTKGVHMKGSAGVIIDGSCNGNAVELSASDTVLEGFTVTNATYNSGPDVDSGLSTRSLLTQGVVTRAGTAGGRVKNCTITGNNLGIMVMGENGTILGNDVRENRFGVLLYGNNNTVAGNAIEENYDGLILGGGPDRLNETSITTGSLTAGAAEDENTGMGILGVSKTEIVIHGAMPARSGNIINCNSISWNVRDGIEMCGAVRNVIADNSIQGNGRVGIYGGGSSMFYIQDLDPLTVLITILHSLVRENEIRGNTLQDNGFYGFILTIDPSWGGNNFIYNNRFINNGAWSDSINVWNTTKTPGTNIVGGPYLGGNFWSNYAGADLNGDGIGDTEVPYMPGGNSSGDHLPLILFSVERPVAGFTADPTSGSAPLTVQFNDTSTGSPAAWNWSFGDGAWFNTTDPLERNATHTYTAAGTYTVFLNVSNANGSDTITKASLIAVTPGASTSPVHNLNTGIDYATIGDAITDAATLDGHTILIDSGTYVESVNVTKSLTLRGRDTGAGLPTLDGRNLNTVIQIPADNVVIEELIIVNATSGILITGDRAALRNVTVTSSWIGVRLDTTREATLESVKVRDNYHGIQILGAPDTTISDSEIDHNRHMGIYVNQRSGIVSENVTFTRCSIEYNGDGFSHNVDGTGVPAAGLCIQKGGSERVTVHDCTFTGNLNYGIYSDQNNGNTISGTAFRDHTVIALVDEGGNDGMVAGNLFEGNYVALYYYGENNTITRNTIRGNANGIWLDADGNTIYDNILDNAHNARDPGVNAWNITKQPGKNIIGGDYIGGNAWSGYTGRDADGDGLGDTAIPWKGINGSTMSEIENGGDMLPLTTPGSLPDRVHTLETGRWYPTIQRAIDDPATLAGHTIQIGDGEFVENVNVTKAVHLKGSGSTVIGASENGNAIILAADGASVDDLRVTNSSYGDVSDTNSAGICVLGNSAAIGNITADGNDFGVYVRGDAATISGSTIEENSDAGIFTGWCTGTTIADSLIRRNAHGVSIGEAPVHDSILPGAGATMVYIHNMGEPAYHTVIRNLVEENTGDGIRIGASSNNTVEKNTIRRNGGHGIDIGGSIVQTYGFDPNDPLDILITVYETDSSANIIRGNTFSGNGGNSILNDPVTFSRDGLVYDNAFFDDAPAASSYDAWNLTVGQPGPNIVGGPYIGGNYWSDYTGADTDGDGIGDTNVPYTADGAIEESGDHMPLVLPAGSPLVANFTASPTEGVAPLTVQFNDTSTGDLTAWSWLFGDGAWFNTTDPSARNATHTYATPGVYSVNLTVANAYGSSCLYRQDYITVTPALPALVSITVVPDTATLVAGENWQFEALCRDQYGDPMSGVTVDWSVGNGSVGTIDAHGLFTAVAEGTTNITAAAGSDTGTATVTITLAGPVLASIVVAPASAAMEPGESRQFGATGYDQYGAEMPVTAAWFCNNTAVGTIDSTGLFSALAPGIAMVNATNGTVTGSAVITVTESGPEKTGSIIVGSNVTGASILVDGADTGKKTVAAGNVTLPEISAGLHSVGVGNVTSYRAPPAQMVAVPAGRAVDVMFTFDPLVLSTIVVSPGSVALEAGDQQQLHATGYDQYGEEIACGSTIWSCANETVGTIDATGLFSASTAGTATITASAFGVTGVATVTVTVEEPVLSSITVNPAEITLPAGDTQRFEAFCRDQHGELMSGVAVDWSVENGSVGTIDANGLFTAVSGGTTLITATSGNLAGTATVTVTPAGPAPVGTIIVSPAAVTLDAGYTQQFTAACYDVNGAHLPAARVTWASSDASVGTIDDGGLFTALTEGTVTVTATAEGVDGTAAVTVRPVSPVLTRIEVFPPCTTLDAGCTRQFSATGYDQFGNEIPCVAVTWSCSDPCVGTIDSCGLFTAASPGAATITASAQGIGGTASVTVRRPLPVLACIEVIPADVTLDAGCTRQFSATAYDQYGNRMDCVDVVWSCSDPCVGQIDACGLFTALSAGKATVTASAECIFGTACVTVEADPTPSVKPFANFTANVTCGERPLTVRFTDCSTGSPVSYLWEFGCGCTSTDPSPVHTYDTAGTYTVSLTVTNADGSDTCHRTGYITVAEPPQPVADTSGDSPSQSYVGSRGSSSPPVPKGNSGSVTFSGFNQSAVTGVTLTGLGDIERAILAVERTDLPAGVELPEFPVYEYIEITLNNTDSVDIGSAIIEFSVPVSWFEENNLNPEDAVLLHCVGGVWQPLTTGFLGEAESLYQFRATSGGFSCFAVAAASNGDQTAEEPGLEAIAAPVTTPATPLLLAPVLAPVILVLLGGKRRH